MQDLYAVLGVPPRATQAEIRRKYHQLAREYHTDITTYPSLWAEEQIKQINGAYEVLCNPCKRAAYDAIAGSLRPSPLPDSRGRADSVPAWQNATRAGSVVTQESTSEFWRRWWKVA